MTPVDGEHSQNRRRHSGRSSRGFTLIEMMAVVVIMGLVFAIGAPRLGASKLRILKQEAEAIAASLDFARQRAVMTARPHRLFIDLEEGGYRIEWLTSEEEIFDAFSAENDERGFEDETAPEEDPNAPLDLRPPDRSDRDFFPIPHREYGAFSWIDDAVYFVGLNSSAGWIEGGDVVIGFEADGTTEFSLLEIADSDDNHLTLEIEPMLERVRRRPGKARS
jgi:type II secretion system protein H